MKLRLISLALMAAVLSAFVVAPLSAKAQPQTGGTATFGELTSNTGETVTGTVSNLSATFNQATGVTTISGTFTQDVTGAVDTFSARLLQASGSCEILRLVLGPLHLDLLGLVVDLNQVVLVITAEPGLGNLLGNLLCAIAGLLDSNALGLALTNLLNRLFDLLG